MTAPPPSISARRTDRRLTDRAQIGSSLPGGLSVHNTVLQRVAGDRGLPIEHRAGHEETRIERGMKGSADSSTITRRADEIVRAIPLVVALEKRDFSARRVAVRAARIIAAEAPVAAEARWPRRRPRSPRR
jgi:hypothetical protein